MKLHVTAVYADAPLPHTKPVDIQLWDSTIIGNVILFYIDYLKGNTRSPFVKLVITPESIIPLQRQGIDTYGLTHFVHEFKPLLQKKEQ